MATPTSDDRTSQLTFAPNLLENASIANTKFISACFAGAAAGILGLENWAGFVLFSASTLVASAMIYTVRCKGRRPGRYFRGGAMELISPGKDNAFTFVLVWTLFYGEFLAAGLQLALF